MDRDSQERGDRKRPRTNDEGGEEKASSANRETGGLSNSDLVATRRFLEQRAVARADPLLLQNTQPWSFQQRYPPSLSQSVLFEAIRPNPYNSMGLQQQQQSALGSSYGHLAPAQDQHSVSAARSNFLQQQLLENAANAQSLLLSQIMGNTTVDPLMQTRLAQLSSLPSSYPNQQLSSFASISPARTVSAAISARHNARNRTAAESTAAAQSLQQNYSFPTSPAATQAQSHRAVYKQQISQYDSNADVAPSGRPPVFLYLPSDEGRLSAYQCLARKQIEFFEAGDTELDAGAQGRNKPIANGQVGIRCRHCAHLTARQKTRASGFYPSKLVGIYQAAQNIANTHLTQKCNTISSELRKELLQLQAKKSAPGGGKKYWVEAAEQKGVYNAADGIRFLREDRS